MGVLTLQTAISGCSVLFGADFVSLSLTEALGFFPFFYDRLF